MHQFAHFQLNGITVLLFQMKTDKQLLNAKDIALNAQTVALNAQNVALNANTKLIDALETDKITLKTELLISNHQLNGRGAIEFFEKQMESYGNTRKEKWARYITINPNFLKMVQERTKIYNLEGKDIANDIYDMYSRFSVLIYKEIGSKTLTIRRELYATERQFAIMIVICTKIPCFFVAYRNDKNGQLQIVETNK